MTAKEVLTGFVEKHPDSSLEHQWFVLEAEGFSVAEIERALEDELDRTR